MTSIETISFILELIGTIAFSISGSLIAISKKMDIFGVIILGLTTALGGGVIRDIILGINPPSAFTNYSVVIVSILISIIVFLPPIRNRLQKNNEIFDKILLIMDSIGLGIFTAIGIKIAYSIDTNILLLIFVGVVTGVGGGVLRDILAGNVPYIFTKHFYASASIIGAVVIILLWNLLSPILSMTIGVLVIFILRLLAAHYRWKLPRA